MKYVIANFKSNKNSEEIADWVKQFAPQLQKTNYDRSTTIVLCPAFPHLSLFDEVQKITTVFIGVQDISPYPAGSYTGAVSSLNLEGLGVKYAIIGHSERRRYFHETNTDVANKVRECIEHNIVPIICVTKDEINAQANAIDESDRKKLLVTFEPIEHIGSDETDTIEHILDVKEHVKTAFGNVPFLYGGSVNSTSDRKLLTSPEIDGFLVGSASLKVETFTDLLGSIA